jgi:ProP effector
MTAHNGEAGDAALREPAGQIGNGSGKPPIDTKPHRKAAITLAILAELFPQTFAAEPWQPHRPLKVGIGDDLHSAGVLLPAECKVLRWYVARRMYQVALAAGGPRYDLDGNVAGEVTIDQIEAAKASLAAMDRRRAELADAARNAKAAERAKRKAVREAEQAKAGREFIEARRTVREAAERPMRPAPYHRATSVKIAAQPPRPVTSGPPRLSLSDLKAAFRARQAGAP